jgi:hypothetical protein
VAIPLFLPPQSLVEIILKQAKKVVGHVPLYALTEDVERLVVNWQIANSPSLDHAVEIADPWFVDYIEWDTEMFLLLDLQRGIGGG